MADGSPKDTAVINETFSPTLLRKHLTAVDTPFLSEGFVLPKESDSLLCHPGNKLHGSLEIEGDIFFDTSKRIGWGSENFFNEAAKDGSLRQIQSVIYYNTPDDPSVQSSSATLLVKGPKMENGVRKGDPSYGYDFKRYNFTAAIVAECPEQPALLGILCIGQLTGPNKSQFIFVANRYPSIQSNLNTSSGAEIIATILRKKGFPIAASNVEIMASFTKRLRTKVDSEFQYYKQMGVYTDGDNNVNVKPVVDYYKQERIRKDEILKKLVAELVTKGILQESPQFPKIFGYDLPTSPLESEEAKRLLTAYDQGSGEFSLKKTAKKRRESLRQLITLVGEQGQLILADTTISTPIFITETFWERVRNIRKFAQLTDNHKDFRADEVRNTLRISEIMLYPEELLAQLVAQYNMT